MEIAARIAACAWWMLVGAGIALGATIWHGKRAFERHEHFAPYAERLGKACWIVDRMTGEEAMYRVVAVSHKGAVNIRPWADESGKGAFWVPSDKVAERVRFEGGVE